MVDVTFERALYLGGFVGAPSPQAGSMYFTIERIYVQPSYGGRTTSVTTSSVGSVEVTSQQIAKSNVGAAIAFGTLGALAARSSQNETTLVLRLNGDEIGEQGYYTLKKRSAAEDKAKLGPWLRAHKIPWFEDWERSGVARQPSTAATASTVGIADELTKLAQLRDSGVLSEDEFARLKTRLLPG